MSEAAEIRIGTAADFYPLVDLAEACTFENALLEPDPEMLRQNIWEALNEHWGFAGVMGKEGEPLEGAVILRIGQMWYSKQMMLEERAVYVRPDLRAAKDGRMQKLCDFAKARSDEMGLPLLIGVLSNQRTEAKVRLYQRQFGPQSGALFVYGAKTGEWHGNE